MEKRKNNRKQVIIGVSILLLVTLLLLGLTYAYYRTRIVGNSNSESISVTSKNLEVTYQDDNPQVITEKGISPGYTEDKKFSVENTGDATASYSIILDQKENGFKRSEDWKYKLYKGETKETEPISQGTIAVGSEQIIYGKADINEKTTDKYILEIEYDYLEDVDQSEDMGATLSFRVNIGEEKVTWDNAPQGTLLNAIKTNTQGMTTEPETTPGEKVSRETEKVFAATEDDYGTSYYYRGAVDNNYVTFADMCWRIVRIQGDGSIKITLYDKQHTCQESTTPDGKGAFIGADDYRDSVDSCHEDMKFGSSNVKTTLDNWYNSPDIDLSTYEKDIETKAEWCNDISKTKDGTDNFGTYKRLPTNYGDLPTGPSLKCKSLNDNNDESIYIGMIGLLSADEVAFAGSTTYVDSGPSIPSLLPYYLTANASGEYWTMSPQGLSEYFLVFYRVGDYGYLDYRMPTCTPDRCSSYSVRPAVVLKSSVLVSTGGTGKIDNPFIVE